MNFIKSGWSYLSNSFTQDEEDGHDPYPDSVDELGSAGEVLVPQESAPGDTTEELNQFMDAIDTVDLDVLGDTHKLSQGTVSGRLDGSDSQGVSNSSENVAMFECNVDTSVAKPVSEEDSNVVSFCANITKKDEMKAGYTALEESISDDSGEFLPPPTKPVGPRENTDICSDERFDDPLNFESQIGDTLYLTAFDKTVSPTSQEQTFSDPQAKESPDSAFACSQTSTASSSQANKSNHEDAARPSTPAFHTECVDGYCNSPANHTVESVSLNSSIVSVKHTDCVSKSIEEKSIQAATEQNGPENSLKRSALEEVSSNSSLSKDKPTHFETKTAMENPVEEIPIARGSYTLDFDSLDNYNPFQSGKGLKNSPDLPSKTLPELPRTDLPVEETAQGNNHIDSDGIANVTAGHDSASSVEKDSMKVPQSSEPTEQSECKEESQNVTKGSYTIDFTQLDDFDPFKTSKGLTTSPTKEGRFDPFSSNKTLPASPPKSPVKITTPLKSLGNNETPDDQIKSAEVESAPKPSGEMIVSEMGNLENVDPLPKKLAKKPALGQNRKKMVKPKSVKKKSRPVAPSEPPVDGEEDIIVPKGSYSINFDELDSFDPFKTSKGLSNSPTKVVSKNPLSQAFAEQDNSQPDLTNQKVQDKSSINADVDATSVENIVDETVPSAKGSYSLDLDHLGDINPFATSKEVANSPLEERIVGSSISSSQFESEDHFKSQTREETPSSHSLTKSADMKEPGSAKKVTEKPVAKIQPLPNTNELDEMPPPKASYNLDFDNLDAVDPFKSGKGLANSPTEEKSSQYAFDPDNLDSIDPFKASKAVANSPLGSPTKTHVKELMAKTMSVEKGAVPNEEVGEPAAEKQSKSKSPPKQMKKKSGLAKKGIKKTAKKTPPVSTVVADEEALPVLKGAYNLDFDNLDSLDPFKSNKGLSNSPTDVKPQGYSVDFDNLDSLDPFKSAKAIPNSPPSSPIKKTTLESESTDDVARDNKENDKSLNTQSPAPKKTQRKDLARKKLVNPSLKSEDEAVAEPVASKGSYNFDLDSLDSTDPFKASKGVANSPTKDHPKAKCGYSLDSDDLDSVNPFKSATKMKNSLSGSPEEQDIFTDAKTVVCSKEDAHDSGVPSNKRPLNVASRDRPTAHLSRLHQAEFEKINENEEFFPASSVFQDSASLDYLDKLADTQSFNESKLRKQSLYVKFDPLVSSSPQSQIQNQLRKDAAAFRESRGIDEKAKGDSVVVEKVVKRENISQRDISKSSAVMEERHSPTDSYRQSNSNRHSTSLKYTQADFEAAVKQAELKWQKKHQESLQQEHTLRDEFEQMTKVVSEYDRLFAEMANSGMKTGMMTREQQLLTAEHEQTLEDMASLERSHEDLCRRYNRLKTVLAQFKQNEEILKASTNEMLQEAKDTEKKYMTLKKQSEESIRKANEELQSVKANAQQEVARAQAQLKLLELKCDSLQNQVRECSKENEELTKLCDDLIACSKQPE